MKLIILVLSLASVAFAQLDLLIEHEVGVIVNANPSITVDACASTCDGLFNLVDVVDEGASDAMCRQTCDCKINNNCVQMTTADAPAADPSTTAAMGDSQTTQQAQVTTKAPAATTQAPHHTHPPHPTHPPHHTHPPHPTHPDHGNHGK